MQFLKKHYEKIILCAVLLGLAAAAIVMGSVITKLQEEVSQPVSEPAHNTKLVVPLDLTADLLALDKITNPPPVVLSGDHNLFNPVTWRRKPNGELLKILKTGPDALRITGIAPLFTVITYERPSSGGVYISFQQRSGKKTTEYAKKDEKVKSGFYTVRGITGAPDDPKEINLELSENQETVSISKDNPYKRVDGYMADMRYDPESHNLPKLHVNDPITLDNEQYKIVEITNNVVRVQSVKSTKVTTIIWNGNP